MRWCRRRLPSVAASVTVPGMGGAVPEACGVGACDVERAHQLDDDIRQPVDRPRPPCRPQPSTCSPSPDRTPPATRPSATDRSRAVHDHTIGFRKTPASPTSYTYAPQVLHAFGNSVRRSDPVAHFRSVSERTQLRAGATPLSAVIIGWRPRAKRSHSSPEPERAVGQAG